MIEDYSFTLQHFLIETRDTLRRLRLSERFGSLAEDVPLIDAEPVLEAIVDENISSRTIFHGNGNRNVVENGFQELFRFVVCRLEIAGVNQAFTKRVSGPRDIANFVLPVDIGDR